MKRNSNDELMSIFNKMMANNMRLKSSIKGLKGDNIVFVGTDSWINSNFLNPKNSDTDLETFKKNAASIEQIKKNGL